MKKLVAIFLILLLFFNWYGYRLATWLMLYQASQKQELVIDQKQYNESQLFEISVPLSLPYQLNDDEFERCYGEVEVDGKFYTYVERKIANGFLILKCLPNIDKEKIQTASNDYFKMTYGIGTDHTGKNNQPNVAKCFWSEYEPVQHFIFSPVYGLFDKKKRLYSKLMLASMYLSVLYQPPEMPVV